MADTGGDEIELSEEAEAALDAVWARIDKATAERPADVDLFDDEEIEPPRTEPGAS